MEGSPCRGELPSKWRNYSFLYKRLLRYTLSGPFTHTQGGGPPHPPPLVGGSQSLHLCPPPLPPGGGLRASPGSRTTYRQGCPPVLEAGHLPTSLHNQKEESMRFNELPESWQRNITKLRRRSAGYRVKLRELEKQLDLPPPRPGG